jgi:hypothetical protein
LAALSFRAPIPSSFAARLSVRSDMPSASAGSAEREIARLEAVGKLDGVELHIVHWQTDEAIAAANELMRKRKATNEQRGSAVP